LALSDRRANETADAERDRNGQRAAYGHTRIGRRGFAPPSRAATQPVIASASSTAATVTAMRADAGGRRTAMLAALPPQQACCADERC